MTYRDLPGHIEKGKSGGDITYGYDVVKQFNSESEPIKGDRRCGTGILNNDLYIGQLVWNRQKFFKDPDTGKRVVRPNPVDEWQITEVPHLRIIEQDLWDKPNHGKKR